MIRLRKVAEAEFPTQFGRFRIYGFEGRCSNGPEQVVVLKMGEVGDGTPPLVRIHSRCLAGDVFQSLRCDCQARVEVALTRIAEEGRGLLIYEYVPRPVAGLVANLRASALQTAPHGHEMAAAVLEHFGVSAVRLLSNDCGKAAALEGSGISVRLIPCWAGPVLHAIQR